MGDAILFSSARPANLYEGGSDAPEGSPLVGVLALQGGFHEHKVMISQYGCRVVEIRQASLASFARAALCAHSTRARRSVQHTTRFLSLTLTSLPLPSHFPPTSSKPTSTSSSTRW